MADPQVVDDLAPMLVRDYRELARRRLDPAVWDFVEGGAGEERTLRANQAAFDRIRLLPRVLVDVSRCNPSVEILKRRWCAPVAVAPMAFHTLVHPDGELATVRAAGDAGLPVVVSTFAGRTLEELSAVARAPLWLQIYCFRDRSVTRRLLERAAEAGIEALMLTVDAPFLGRRIRDLRNDFRLPAGVRPANLPGTELASPMAHSRLALDPTLDWSILSWLRSVSSLPLLIKGILTADDARRAVDHGVDGIVVSNHGGRQLDGAVATLDALPAVAAAVAGTCPILIDGGIRRGTDILAALALGASAVLIGRPVLHALAVNGQSGVHAMLSLLTTDLSDTMALTGHPDLTKIDSSLLAHAPLGTNES